MKSLPMPKTSKESFAALANEFMRMDSVGRRNIDHAGQVLSKTMKSLADVVDSDKSDAFDFINGMMCAAWQKIKEDEKILRESQ